jgi:hypothetical protein
MKSKPKLAPRRAPTAPVAGVGRAAPESKRAHRRRSRDNRVTFMMFKLLPLLAVVPRLAPVEEGLTARTMQPINAFATCLVCGVPADRERPFAARWRAGFVRHLLAGRDRNVRLGFGPTQDFRRPGKRV